MFFRCPRVLLCALVPALAMGEQTLRVCADPNNLPFSNREGQGFENRLAELIAAKIGAQLQYTWWAERKSFVKNSLDAGQCDVVMGVPSSLPSVLTTKPYYRSTYVFVSRHDRSLNVTSLNDPRFAHWRIGVHVVGDDYAPPAAVLAGRGVTNHVIGFSLFGQYGESNPPGKIVDAVRNGDLDVAIVWGPFAGYFAKQQDVPLDIVPVSPPAFHGIPFTYDISAAVRNGDNALKAQLDSILESEHAAVAQILSEYRVPEAP